MKKSKDIFVLLLFVLLVFHFILIVVAYRPVFNKPAAGFGVKKVSNNSSSNSTLPNIKGASVEADNDFFKQMNSIPLPKFKILNLHDGLSLTIEGVNASYARVVGENWTGFTEQKWEIKKTPGISSTYGLFPSRYTYNSALTYHKDPAQKYPTIVSWEIKKTNTSTMNKHPEYGYQFINERTKQCLRSEGRRRAVVELKCDIYDKKQLWKITKV